MKTPKHTQGEWRINKHSSTTIEVGDNGRTIATCGGYSSNVKDFTEENEANAQRIVKAVNMHDELVGLLGEIKEWSSQYGLKAELFDKVDRLLKQAEQK